MSTLPFDTHAFYVELVESELAEKTADALTKAITKIELTKLEELATKRDLAEIKVDLIKWVVSVGILQITVITALILKLAH
jgi:hypothetical protein